MARSMSLNRSPPGVPRRVTKAARTQIGVNRGCCIPRAAIRTRRAVGKHGCFHAVDAAFHSLLAIVKERVRDRHLQVGHGVRSCPAQPQQQQQQQHTHTARLAVPTFLIFRAFVSPSVILQLDTDTDTDSSGPTPRMVPWKDTTPEVDGAPSSGALESSTARYHGTSAPGTLPLAQQRSSTHHRLGAWTPLQLRPHRGDGAQLRRPRLASAAQTPCTPPGDRCPSPVPRPAAAFPTHPGAHPTGAAPSRTSRSPRCQCHLDPTPRTHAAGHLIWRTWTWSAASCRRHLRSCRHVAHARPHPLEGCTCAIASRHR